MSFSKMKRQPCLYAHDISHSTFVQFCFPSTATCKYLPLNEICGNNHLQCIILIKISILTGVCIYYEYKISLEFSIILTIPRPI